MQALSNQDITVYGDGSQTRSFCYVDDMIDGLVRMMNSPEDFIGPVNIGNPREYSVVELARKTLEITGSKSKIVFKPLPQDDPMKRQPDITLARKHLGWEPRVGLEEGLKRTIKYFMDFSGKMLSEKNHH
jgi:UDP-glucuronate decarboxylase